MIGIVKWFDIKKGYGFIDSNLKEDIFCHYSVINKLGFKYLKEEDIVEFDIIKSDDGLRANNVKIVKESNNVK